MKAAGSKVTGLLGLDRLGISLIDLKSNRLGSPKFQTFKCFIDYYESKYSFESQITISEPM